MILAIRSAGPRLLASAYEQPRLIRMLVSGQPEDPDGSAPQGHGGGAPFVVDPDAAAIVKGSGVLGAFPIAVIDSHTEVIPGKILADFEIEAWRQSKGEVWAEWVESFDNQDPCQALLDRAAAYHCSHDLIARFFQLLKNDWRLPTPFWFWKLSQWLYKAMLADIPVKAFEEHAKICMEDAQKEDPSPPEGGDRSSSIVRAKALLGKIAEPIQVACTYDGPWRLNFQSVVHYSRLKLLRITSSESVDRAAVARPREADEAFRLVPPDFSHLGETAFSYVAPPRPGEPKSVTKMRVYIEWIEGHAGQILRECFVSALTKGDRMIGAESTDPFASPLHMLAAGIEQKLGRNIPYWVGELCINHGLTAWQLVTAYDEAANERDQLPELDQDRHSTGPEWTRLWTWDFTLGGLQQNIHEICASAIAFQAEIEYTRDLLPWIISGKAHPALVSYIRRMINKDDYRQHPRDAGILLDNIRLAVNYLGRLIEVEERDTETSLLQHFDRIFSLDLKAQVRPHLLNTLSASSAKEFRKGWGSVLAHIHSDRTMDEQAEIFLREFIRFALIRKKSFE